MQALPEPTLQQNPSLMLLQGWLTQSLLSYGEVNTRLEQVGQAMLHYQLQLDADQQAEFEAFRAQVALNGDRPQEARALARSALAQLPATSFYSRIVASSVLGEVHHSLGELASALSVMVQTEQMARQHGTYHYVLWALLQQSEILLAQGYLQRADDIHEQRNIFV